MTAIALPCWPTARMDAGEAEYVKMARRQFTDGVHAGTDDTNEFKTFGDSTGMQAKVDTGCCSIQGVYAESLTLRTIGVATAHGSLDRLDRMVLRLDKASPYTIYLDILTGIASSTPVEPSLTVSSSIIEIPLAKVIVGHGVTTIRVQDVIDERTYSAPRQNVPIGTVLDTLLATAPDGFLLLQGQTGLVTANYPAYAQAMGITTSTFSLPDLRRTITRGADGDRGSFGGQDQTILSVGQLPSHDHDAAAAASPTFQYVIASPNTETQHLPANPGGAGNVQVTYTPVPLTAKTGQTGNFDAIPTLPHYFAINKMVRVF